MRERIVVRTFSGYRVNLPKGLKLTARDCRTGEVWDLTTDLTYWAMKSAATIFESCK